MFPGNNINETEMHEVSKEQILDLFIQFAEKSLSPISLTDEGEYIRFVNHAFCEMLGYEKAELMGKNLRQLTNRVEFSNFQVNTYLRKKGISGNFETTLYKKDENPVPVQISASPVMNESGKLILIMGIVTNLSEYYQRIREAELKVIDLNNLLHNLPHIVFESNLFGELNIVNESAFPLLGYKREDFGANMNFRDLIHPEDRARLMNNIRKMTTGEFTDNGTPYRIMKKDGKFSDILTYTNLVLKDGYPVGLAGIAIVKHR